MAIDTCVENFSGDALKVVAASTPKRRPLADPRPLILDGIQDEIRLKKAEAVAGHQRPHSES
jgi:hypothetical protein